MAIGRLSGPYHARTVPGQVGFPAALPRLAERPSSAALRSASVVAAEIAPARSPLRPCAAV